MTNRTFVGFGFGAIQAGLFLYEAHKSGNFARLVVAEVIPEIVYAVREAGGTYACNIAHADRIEQVTVGPVEIYNPQETDDHEPLIAALAEANEIATAVPSVHHYIGRTPGALAGLMSAGLRRKIQGGGRPAVVYAAENHNRAAQILQEKIAEHLSPKEVEALATRVKFLNTVIGKMSGIVTDPKKIKEYGLQPVTPELDRAFLVEVFNRILISQINFPPGSSFQRGIEIFEEKPDLLPFEEAKLYGHNATHALGAYIGKRCGVEAFADLPGVPGLLLFMETAFLKESGAALIRKHHRVDDLFTPQGYFDYAQDLLRRMTNPHLHDTIARVARGTRRKLGWDDRLVGTMRAALSQGINPAHYAFGTAAALVDLQPTLLTKPGLLPLTQELWQSASPDPDEATNIRDLLTKSLHRLHDWETAGLPHLESHFMRTPGS